MTATGSTRTHEALVPELVFTPAAPTRVKHLTFWAYMTLDEIPYLRPLDRGLREKSAENYDRNLFQIYLEMGHPLLDRATVHRLRCAVARDEPAPIPLQPWEMEAPEWEAILAWRDTKVKATLETQQKALVWLANYWGQSDKNMPLFLQKEWATEKAKNDARQRGEMEEYDLHFDDLPNDISKLLGARPFEAKLRASKMRGNRRMLREARYKDKLGRSIVFQWFYSGPRCSEGCTLTLDMIRPSQGGIVDWPQPKKGGATRDVIYNDGMDFVWTSKVDPSFQWYIERVRPTVLDGTKPTNKVYLNTKGEPWTEAGLRNFVREYVKLALDGEGRGTHSLRRACATWQYHNGWEIPEIARFLDDTEDVVRSSYINWTWIKRAGRVNERSTTRRPAVPLVRSNGTTNARRQRPESAETKQPPQTKGVLPKFPSANKRPDRDLNPRQSLDRALC